MYFFIPVFFSGIVFGLFCCEQILLYLHFNLLLLIFAVISLILTFYCNAGIQNKIYRMVFAFCLGILWDGFYVDQVHNWKLPNEYENKAMIVKGYIASIPKTDERSTKFTYYLQSIGISKTNAKIQLSWYGNHPYNLQVGDEWQLLVKMKKPHGFNNPGNFFHNQHFFAEGIQAIGYVSDDLLNQKIASHWYRLPLDRLRQSIEKVITNTLPGNRFVGVLTAITVGSYNGLTQNDWLVLRNTGTVHLVAIAGLHIGFVAGFVYAITNILWRLFPRLLLIIPATEVAKLTAFGAALIYSALAGFALPTQRTILMLAVFTFTLLLRRNQSPWCAFYIALLLVLLGNPLSVFSVGFWLSFGAVGGLIYAFSGRFGKKNLWWQFGRVQLVVTFSLLPFCLWWFQQFGLLTFFANLIAVPVFGFIILPLTLLGCLVWLISGAAAKFLWLIVTKGLAILWLYLQWLASHSWAIWQHPITSPWLFISVLVAVIIFLAPNGFPRYFLGSIWLLPLIFYHPSSPAKGELWFMLLDVGQGLASVIRTQNHILIYDAGPKFDINVDAGGIVVVPFLRWIGIGKIDALVISHGDSDHSGGAQTILHNLPVATVFTSVPTLFRHYNTMHCWDGESWQWDGVKFEFIYPFRNTNLQGNDASCVLKITNGVNSILLPGDIGSIAESKLLEKHKQDLAATILVIPHHGSTTSSTINFVEAVHPEYALVASGYLNRFHFPVKRIISRYKEINAKILNTAESGAISFKLTATQVALQ